jgi:PAS domain S-box-containing protein
MSSLTGGRAPTLRWPQTGPEFLAGGGEMGKRMRELDWSTTPLGPPSGWPQSLKTIVRVMLDSRYAMWMLWGPELTFFCNDSYLPTVGVKRDWVLGARSDKVWEEIWPDIGPRIAQVLEHGRATWDEALLLFLERSGFPEETYHTFSYSPVYDDEDRIAGMLCVVTEVTERVIGERRLRTLRDLAARPAGSITVDEACKRLMSVLEADPLDVPFASLYLLEGEDGLRLNCQCRTPPALLGNEKIVLPESSSAWRPSDVLHGDAVLIDLPAGPDGVNAPLWPDPVTRAIALPVQGSGSSSCIAMLVAGISPRRALDEEYRAFFELVAKQFAAEIADAQAYESERRRAEALAEIDRAKTIFFSNVSHEFRTPLTLMLGPIEEATAHPATSAPVRNLLEIAHGNSLRLLKLVNSLLDFSRIEAGRLRASFEPTDLAALTADIASSFRSAIERAGLQFRVECPSLDAPVYIDREMWEKVVLNLLSNAFKFTFQGAITVRLLREGSCAVLEVSDTGVGIPEAELPRLFERFHRVEGSAGRTQEGSGIGLALVQELVKLHGGTVAVTSRLEGGTTFRIRLPFGREHLPGECIRAPRSGASSAVGSYAFVQEALRWLPSTGRENTTRLSALVESQTPMGADQRFAHTAGARILFADDNADMRAYISDLLSPMYTVESVVDGKEALDSARRHAPDLILSDIMMPRVSGLALLKAVRADERLREVPVILLSARAGEEARVEGLDAGADDYLVKPFSARELLARVGALLELTSMRRESEERFRALVSATSDVIYRMSPDWSEMRYLQGRSFLADTLDPSRTWLERYVFPEDQQHLLAAIREAVRAKSTFQLEHRVWRVDGSIGWTLSRAVPLLDARGEILEWFGAASDVTERKQTEQVLREREEQLRLATDAAEVGFWDVDMVTDTLYWPARVKAMFGISADVAVSMADFYSGLHPEDVEPTSEAFAAALDPQRRALYDVEYRTVGKEDGVIRWVAAKGRGIFDDSGRCVRVIGTAIDISARKRAEERLREETRVQELLGKISHALVAAQLDIERVVQIATDAATELSSAAFGAFFYNMQDEKGDWYRLYALSGAPREAFARFPQPRSTSVFGATFRGEGVVRSADITADPRYGHNHPYRGMPEGHLRVRSYLAVPVKTASGQVLGGLFFGHPDPGVFDERAERLALAVAAQAAVAVENARLHQAAQREIEQRRRMEGHLASLAREREQLLEAERAARADAEAANHLKDEFLATVSHELRTPLSTVVSWSRVLQKKYESGDAQLRRGLSVIADNARLQAQIISDLLDMSRVVSGKIQLELMPADLAQLTENAVEGQRPAAEAKGINLAVETDPEPIIADVDAGRLQQVLWNLLSNAIKFTPENGSVCLRLQRTGDWAELIVRDTGIGIPAHFLPHAFDRFRQAEGGTGRRFGGLGLGLAIVKQLVELHGGTVEASSEGEGRGSRFTVRLPLLEAHLIERDGAAKGDAERVSGHALQGMRILAVEDDAAMLEVLVRVLTEYGANVTSAPSAAAALAALNAAQFDLLLSDIGLPGMDGYELMRSVRARYSEEELPAIAVTAFAREQDRALATEVGFQAYLTKPYEVAKVVGLARRLGATQKPVR